MNNSIVKGSGCLRNRIIYSSLMEQPADLILMDVSLPGIDGFEATRRIKGDARLISIPLIILTAHAMEADKKRAWDAGCDGFETKPINEERLLGVIEGLNV